MLELMINSEVVKVVSAKADTMLLNYLREQKQMTGSKEGCASGDCGACTVVLVSLEGDNVNYRQINACITPIHSLHGKQVVTVEHLKQSNQLHPVQQIVVDKHGTQCGFCTPGFVMSLYALSKQTEKPQHPADFLAGNLCRCTGYGPLIEAANTIATTEIEDPLSAEIESVKVWMKSVQPLESAQYIKPTTRQALAKARAEHPNAKLIAGGTDLSLEVTQQLKSIPELIDISHVDDLLGITETTSGWRVGAAVPMNIVHEFMKKHFPTTDEVIERLGSLTIRHRATLGGSLGHASPIGDIAPLLMSLQGKIELDDGVNKTLYAPEDYITGYRETLIKPNQWISAIHLPRLAPNQLHAIYKVSKRYEDDIATVTLAINMTIGSDKRVKSCIISAGGVAAKSVRLFELEEVFVGHSLTQPIVNKARQMVTQVIHPLSDVRGSAEYRVKLVQNLLQRFYLESQQVETRLVQHA
ncbi:xanthine dehydrogenase small subunit [Vibrio diazotrophicus]|uniref:Xanthine dehydrogenase small subunit n=1 Tax=Vibrio diazotrophicus TaxID=685 RepID=A0A329E105_VIBDI|nr:xanthine dehydrogenase small subunit [Vibrio diazotrophicus]MCZ4372586.1 xanthine dehydrogenase small subunit [Vibrio diazotrophicus]RAS57121.1 xanthine dehydrogenase small subunit [Vibrio diazotrophicus]